MFGMSGGGRRPPLDHAKIAGILGSTFEPVWGDGMSQYLAASKGGAKGKTKPKPKAKRTRKKS